MLPHDWKSTVSLYIYKDIVLPTQQLSNKVCRVNMMQTLGIMFGFFSVIYQVLTYPYMCIWDPTKIYFTYDYSDELGPLYWEHENVTM